MRKKRGREDAMMAAILSFFVFPPLQLPRIDKGLYRIGVVDGYFPFAPNLLTVQFQYEYWDLTKILDKTATSSTCSPTTGQPPNQTVDHGRPPPLRLPPRGRIRRRLRHPSPVPIPQTTNRQKHNEQTRNSRTNRDLTHQRIATDHRFRQNQSDRIDHVRNRSGDHLFSILRHN
eukprot:Pompholyxophrys_punicea_v1_NODE_25_length_5265_cov_107.938388.p5 type:complete len:174 gc:universal NODE_25_length_5265_cov_107.938388:2909-3430(+)